MRTVYTSLEFPDRSRPGPYVVLNMISTVDGKILSGERDEHVMDLGSEVDRATMRGIEGAVDAVLVGAGTLRATPGLHYGAGLRRYVATESGRIPFDRRFFTDAPALACVLTLDGARVFIPDGIEAWTWAETIDWPEALGLMRIQHAVKKLVVEGGSELNAALLSRDLVDEVFLTIAPKFKLGRSVPTIAGGEPLKRKHLLNFELVSHAAVRDEIFLRYRRARKRE
jgi:riboflavin biosynthesis pyrimidine reductase